MKIDGTQFADDLLQRMQEARDTQKTESTEAVGSEQQTFSLDELQQSSPVAQSQRTEPTELESKLRVTAEKALRGEFESAEAVRGEVVEHILRDRWENKVGRGKTAKMIRSLKPTLVSDPEFTREVDNMLITAARQLDTK